MIKIKKSVSIVGLILLLNLIVACKKLDDKGAEALNEKAQTEVDAKGAATAKADSSTGDKRESK